VHRNRQVPESDHDARLRAETGNRENPRRRWTPTDRRGNIRGSRHGGEPYHRVVRGHREDDRMDGRQEAVRRYDHEAGCTGPCGDGDHQSLQHVSREGDRLYRERAEQEGTGGSEKGRALRALSLTLALTVRGDGGFRFNRRAHRAPLPPLLRRLSLLPSSPLSSSLPSFR